MRQKILYRAVRAGRLAGGRRTWRSCCSCCRMKRRRAPSTGSSSSTCRPPGRPSPGFFAAAVASVLYLVTKNLRYDALAVAVTEVGLAFGAANLVTGMIWGRVIWGDLVDLGPAAHLDAGLLAAVRRLPDAAARRRGAHPAGQGLGGVLDLRLRRRAHRVSSPSSGGGPSIRSRWCGAAGRWIRRCGTCCF